MERMKQMSHLMQRAELVKVELDTVKEELERFVKDPSNRLEDRLNHLLTLGKLGGAHSNWVFRGWEGLDNNPMESGMYVERHYKYDLLGMINYAIEVYDELLFAEFDEFDQYRFSFIEIPDISFLEWLLFHKQKPEWVALVEAMCNQAVLTFNYDW